MCNIFKSYSFDPIFFYGLKRHLHDLFFFFFFLGTSVWFVPFISLGPIVRNQAVITVARMAMVIIALYYLSMGIAMLLGKKSYGY